MPVFPSRNFPAKKSFAFPIPFKFEDDSKKSLSRISQRAKVNFPKHGLLEVRAIEEADKPPQLEFVSAKTKRLVSRMNLGKEKISLSSFGRHPYVRFRELNIRGLPSPMIFAVVVYSGGSGSGYEGYIIGESNEKLKAFTRQPITTSNQGGIFIGDIGNGKGLGAVAWGYIWDFNSEGHYSYHRYEVEIYSFDNKTNLFKKTKTMRTKRKYGGRGEEALRELKLPIKDLLQTVPDLEYLGRYRETGF